MMGSTSGIVHPRTTVNSASCPPDGVSATNCLPTLNNFRLWMTGHTSTMFHHHRGRANSSDDDDVAEEEEEAKEEKRGRRRGGKRRKEKRTEGHNSDDDMKNVADDDDRADDRADDEGEELSTSAEEEEEDAPPVQVQVNHMLRGTLDPDGCVDDVFYDAEEFGDNGSNADDFRLDFRRESVVLPSFRLQGSAQLLVLDFSSSSYDDDDDDDDGVDYENNEDKKSQRRRRSSAFLPPSASPTASAIYANIPPPPPPPEELPLRFLRAGKNDPAEGLRRYEATLAWRKEQGMDAILREANPHFALIKSKYPSYCHLRGKNNEPCFYDKPPKTDLKGLREGGVTLESLLRYYAMVTEFQWQYLERDDLARSIYIIDLDGIGLGDFVGEVIDFTRRASEFTSQHYPERAGCVFIINVPGWFKIIWNVVRQWVDEATLKKIYILRGKEEIREMMQERIHLENLPPEYGGTSVPLGESPEERLLAELVEHNNAIARGEVVCNGPRGNPPCKFCSWVPARSY